MNYLQAEDFLYRLRWHGTKLGLRNITRLLELLNNPHKNLKFIHIAGTNGKGSVAAMLTSIFIEAGIRTGKFTSPHLISLRERITINNRCINPQSFSAGTDKVRIAVEQMNAEGAFPTFFEAITAVALDYFARRKVELVVWETGLGGMYDSTNVVDAVYSIITNVELDHCEYLGDTIEKIAKDKGGIIKSSSRFYTASDKPDALAVFRTLCSEKNVRMRQVSDNNIIISAISPHGIKVSYSDDSIAISEITTNLIAPYQCKNIALSVAVGYDVLSQLFSAKADEVLEAYIRKGLKRVRLSGRCDLVCRHPAILLDSGHNPAGIAALSETLKAVFPEYQIHLAMGVLRDKDCHGMCKTLIPLVRSVYCLEPPSERALPADDLAHVCKGYAGKDVPVVSDHSLEQIVEKYRRTCHNTDKTVLVICGSFYLVGQALKIFGKSRLRVMDKGCDYR